MEPPAHNVNPEPKAVNHALSLDAVAPCKGLIRENSKILFIGEAPGEHEASWGHPLVGASGYELALMLHEAGLADRPGFHRYSPWQDADCEKMINYWANQPGISLTNVVQHQPPNNDFKEYFCVPKADAQAFDPDYKLPYVDTGKYIHPALYGELERLTDEVEQASPNLIVALGGTPLWACTGKSGISKARGAIAHSAFGPKVLATYHPAYVLRQFQERPTVITDLIKASRQCEFSEIRYPIRFLHWKPTLEDLAEFTQRYMPPGSTVGADIETTRKPFRMITCIGFSPHPERAIVVPFVDVEQPDGRYWRSLQDEIAAWTWVEAILNGPYKITWQNGIYDMSWLWREMAIASRSTTDDTMIQHHALYPELLKRLDFLTSIYTEERSHKLIRPKGFKTEKTEE